MKARMGQLDWTDGNHITLLENGTEFFPVLCDGIDAAKHHVHLETYIFMLDRTGRRVLQSLIEACRRGVTVRVVIDGYGSAQHATQVVSDIRQAGGECLVFRPEPKWFAWWIPSRQRLRRMHRKIAIVDDVALVGGINILDDYDDLDPRDGISVPRYDYAVAVRGPMVAYAAHAQRRQWLSLARKHREQRPRHWRRMKRAMTEIGITRAHATTSKEKGVPALPGAVGLQAALVLRDNLRYRRTFEQAYLYAIQHAKNDILIANAYFLPGKPFRRALIRAAARGVRVRILVQGKVEYHMQYHATRALYAPLLAAGVQIVEYMPSYLHAKVAVIDHLATVGSSNIDPFSFLLAREANVIIDDAAFAQKLQASLEAAIASGGHNIAVDAYRRRGLIRRAADALAYLMMRIGVSVAGEPSEE